MTRPDPASPVTDAERSATLFHSLGMGENGQKRPSRNHFVAGGRDEEICRTLVGEGAMRFIGQGELTGGDPAFRVTTEGRAVALDMAREIAAGMPRKSRSAERYERYLAADANLSFGEWLKAGFGDRRSGDNGLSAMIDEEPGL